jgi:hypothetical protein
MGDTRRALELSGKFKNRTLKAVALYGFDKCGNCVNRLKCAEELLSSGNNPKPRPMKYIVDTLMEGCPKTKFKGLGFVPREVAGFLSSECGKCDGKRPICVGYLAQHAGYDTPEQKAALLEKVNKCLKCQDLDNCVHYFMTQLGISKFTLMKSAFLMKFKDCSEKQMMTISLDLPPGTEGNVGGTVAKKTEPRSEEKKEEVCKEEKNDVPTVQ